jgi:cytosine/adenosine deaminase-related metal-dependent hydrolase
MPHMRRISAHLILDGLGNCYSKGILTLDTDGTIIDIQDTHGMLNESSEVEFYSGMIVPGFVNAHCHLELSHMQNFFAEGTGLVPFIKQVTDSRNFEPDKIVSAAERADLLMYRDGIVAVGDIANGPSVFKVKSCSKISYFTFIEALGFDPQRGIPAFSRVKDCLEMAKDQGLMASIVPHAPYSVSPQLFSAISDEAIKTGSILSIHSQESRDEDELYQNGTGAMYNHLAHHLSVDMSSFKATGQNALRSTLSLLPAQNQLLLVHNLYTSQSDIDYIRTVRKTDNTWFVLCPGSNLYIQNKLPDLELFRKNRLQICLGTDSLVSNHQLSILEEMKILQREFPDVSLDELAIWASSNGAKALNINDWAGSIEVGKRPGINLITGLDLSAKKLLIGSRVRKLV